MPREPRMKLETPRERIEEIYSSLVERKRPFWTSGDTKYDALVQYLDEQYEKETADKHVFEEKEFPCCNHTNLQYPEHLKCTCRCHLSKRNEPVSERNEEEKGSWRAEASLLPLKDQQIVFKIVALAVSERNAMIDELVGEVDKLIGNLNFKDMVINVLKSKKK